MLTCTVCECELSGGLDTFGNAGEELCEEHRYAIEDQVTEGAIDGLLKECETLEEELDELEDEADNVRGQLRDKENEIQKLIKELESHGKPVPMW